MQSHIRAFVDRAVAFAPCPECGGTRLAAASALGEDRGQEHRRLLRHAGQRPARRGCARSMSRGRRPLLDALEDLLALLRRHRARISVARSRREHALRGRGAARSKMIKHLGSPLTDVTYVFDEPTAGLHPHDIERMNRLLVQLRDKGNTVLVVEHKPETIAIADHVVDRRSRGGRRGRRDRLRGHRRRAARRRHRDGDGTSTIVRA